MRHTNAEGSYLLNHHQQQKKGLVKVHKSFLSQPTKHLSSLQGEFVTAPFNQMRENN